MLNAELQEKANNVVRDIETVIFEIRNHKEENQQWVLDWMDKLNGLSITF